MALIICPTEGFNSLVSLEDAVAYMADFGYDWPSADPADVQKTEVALRRGTQFLLSSYSINPAHLDPVHPNVKAACCEAAVRALKGDLTKDTDGRVVTEKTVDVITTKYAEGAQGGQMRYPVIDALLKGLTVGGGMTLKLVRG